VRALCLSKSDSSSTPSCIGHSRGTSPFPTSPPLLSLISSLFLVVFSCASGVLPPPVSSPPFGPSGGKAALTQRRYVPPVAMPYL